jgi:hypothetical protein
MRKPLLVAPIGCYFNKLTAVRTTLNCAQWHDFLTFPSHCYCHTYLFITKSALRLTKMSIIWWEESLFVGCRIIVGGAFTVIWASETNFDWNHLSETIEKSSETIRKCLKLFCLEVLCLKVNENGQKSFSSFYRDSQAAVTATTMLPATHVRGEGNLQTWCKNES